MTRKEARRRSRWFLRRFRMRDWKIKIVLQDDPPDWAGTKTSAMGLCSPSPEYKEATIWVSVSRCHAYNESDREVFWHELMHVVCSDAEIRGDENPKREFVWDRIAEICEAAYRWDRLEVEGDAS